MIATSKVLVDSSVWINYFRYGGNPLLDIMINEDLICCNELILTELAPSLIHQNKKNILESLGAIENIPLKIDWANIRKYQLLNLQNGINKVGIPDLIILQQVIQKKLALFAFDKHFKLIRNIIDFDLIEV